MWALAQAHAQFQRSEYERRFGAPFTGEHEGRKIRLEWRESVVGHICMGDNTLFSHLNCHQIVEMQWRWVKLATNL